VDGVLDELAIASAGFMPEMGIAVDRAVRRRE
jgi:hypothetical protein